jgi:signal transduction histidine kinase
MEQQGADSMVRPDKFELPVARQFNMRLEERVSERTRIARELHDTLLQSFQGVLMKFYAGIAVGGIVIPPRAQPLVSSLPAVFRR